MPKNVVLTVRASKSSIEFRDSGLNIRRKGEESRNSKVSRRTLADSPNQKWWKKMGTRSHNKFKARMVYVRRSLASIIVLERHLQNLD